MRPGCAGLHFTISSQNGTCKNRPGMINLVMFKKALLLSGSLFLFSALSDPGLKLPGYDLSRPDEQVKLPSSLHEISGITTLDDELLSCIQDENGVLFILDEKGKTIRRELPFALNGDYEGIAQAGSSVFVLRSDGQLFEIPDHKAEESATVYHSTNVPAMNNEGLCYDARNGRLLIGCKGKTGSAPGLKDRRFIYAFDLKTKKLLSEPVFEFNAAEITRFAIGKGIIPASRANKKGKMVSNNVRVNTSEIAIHPITRQLYLLSASDHMLMVFDLEGHIRHIEKLDPVLFNKPEGITFFSNGDMIITNEGQHREPSLLRFNFKQDQKSSQK